MTEFGEDQLFLLMDPNPNVWYRFHFYRQCLTTVATQPLSNDASFTIYRSCGDGGGFVVAPYKVGDEL